MLRMQRIFLLPPKPLIIQPPVRHKKFGRAIIPHGKPRWMPMARSKMFKEAPKCLIEQDELEHIAELEVEYNRRVRALVQYLDEDYLKYSDVGEAAKEKEEKEEMEHLKLLQANDEANRAVAEKRKERLKREEEERKIEIAAQLETFKQAEVLRLAEVDAMVQRETEQIVNRINPQDLEGAILEALDNPVDYEYAIDTQGHIYRGRTTKSLLVAPEQRELLEPAPSQDTPLHIQKLKN